MSKTTTITITCILRMFSLSIVRMRVGYNVYVRMHEMSSLHTDFCVIIM